MKILAVAVIALCATLNVDAQKKSKYEEVTFVTTVDCDHCAKKCYDLLPREKGVKDLKIEVAKQTVYFQYDPNKTNKEVLRQAIIKLGYEAKEVE